MSALRSFRVMPLVARPRLALVEDAPIEIDSPKTLQGEPHCPTCGGIMKCVDWDTHGTDRVELRWICCGREAVTTESIHREPSDPIHAALPFIDSLAEFARDDDDSLPEGW